MRYLGIDVHVKASVWCLLDDTGNVLERGKVPTTAPDLWALAERLLSDGEFLVGQEVGKLAYFIHDTFAAKGVKILSFNANHLRMIASSRKKTDKRDSYWIAKALQTQMTPHPVYIPTGQVRELRALLSQRKALTVERKRWLARARSHLHGAGYKTDIKRNVPALLKSALEDPTGLDEHLAQALDRCARMEAATQKEIAQVEQCIFDLAGTIADIKRLQTIPALGLLSATMVYAWVGDVSRFRNVKQLASYAGIVPAVRQSGERAQLGGITREGTPQLRACLVQCGHILLGRCASEHAAPLKNKALHIYNARGRRKIAVVAAARHILRLAYYVMRDGTDYDPALLSRPKEAKLAA